MVSSIVLVSAVLLSLALGVLVAQAICVAMFSIFRAHSMQAAQARAMKSTLAAVSVRTLSN